MPDIGAKLAYAFRVSAFVAIFTTMNRRVGCSGFRLLVLLSALLAIPLMHAGAQSVSNRIEISDRLVQFPEAKSGSVLQLQLSSTESSGTLLLEASRPVSVFMGRDLLWNDRKSISISIDSLAALKGTPLKFVFVRPGGTLVRAWLKSELQPDQRQLRRRSYVNEFVVLAGLPVLLLLILLAAAYRRLLGDFLDINRIFSWVSGTEESTGLRNVSTTSLLFSMALVGFISIPVTVVICDGFQVNSLSGYFAWFLTVAAMFSGLLLLRTVMLAILPRIYGMHTGAGQYTGFLSALLVIALVVAITALAGFMGSLSGEFFHRTIIWVWLGGLSVYYTTVLTRLLIASPPNALYLFSYLCISEIIPILLFIGLFQSQAHLDLR